MIYCIQICQESVKVREGIININSFIYETHLLGCFEIKFGQNHLDLVDFVHAKIPGHVVARGL